jgi:hypothetical protein
MNTPLSRCAPSPRSRIALRCGQEDDSLAAGRPLLAVTEWGRAAGKRMDQHNDKAIHQTS